MGKVVSRRDHLVRNDGKGGNPAAVLKCAAAGREMRQKFFFTLAYQ